jgi:antitoxin (DNA-binding transcriptional repressor) of toxin-antitoxin stability system
MTEALNQISFDEFARNLAQIVERVISEGESVVIETGTGERVALKPAVRAKPRRRKKTKEDDEALLSAAGGWADVDADALIKQIYASRTITTRPLVEL